MQTEEKYTCIFGGGAVRGFAYVGAIKALHELNINYDTLVGSSVGAIVAAFVAVGYSYEELKDIFMTVNFELFRDIHFSIGKTFALSKGEVFTNWVREHIERKIYGEEYKKGKNKPVTFSDVEKNLIVYTTDMIRFECKEFSKQETPDFEIAEAVRISCSMPGLMTPVEIDNQKLVDGDLLKSKPLWQLSNNLKLGDNRILEFRLEGEYDSVDNNAIDFLNAIYSCMTLAATDNIISIYGERDDFDYIKINTGNIIIINFNMSEIMRNNLLELGYQQSIEYLTKDLLNKKLKLIDNYKAMCKILRSLSGNIKLDNILRSKLIMGELYMYLADIKDIISIPIYNKISAFKDEFMISAKGRNWFGQPKFKNKKKLYKSLISIVFSIDRRLEKLNHTVKRINSLVTDTKTCTKVN